MQYGGYMTWFIDRRLNGKNKSTVNRQRFLRRYKAQIKQSISEAINKRSVTDVDSGESVSIPTDDISEPMFHQGRGRTTALNARRAAAVVQEAVRDRPARTVKVRMSSFSRFQKMNTSTCCSRTWRCRI